jgi:hypothetical protein
LVNAQWHLCVVALLLLMSVSPRSLAGRIAEGSVLVVAGLTGPFAIALLLAAALAVVVRREWWRLCRAVIIATATTVQLIVLLTSGSASRVQRPLGASVAVLIHIVANRIVLPAFLGDAGGVRVGATAWWQAAAIQDLAAACAVGVFAYGLIRGTWELRMLLCFGLAVLVGALRDPSLYRPAPSGAGSPSSTAEAIATSCFRFCAYSRHLVGRP